MRGATVLYGAWPNWVFNGDGYGDGSGDDYGFGDGSGSGSGDGSGSGYGYGYGSGSGSGDGSGDGSGYGSGYGYGSGSGSGDGSGYWLMVFKTTRLTQPRVQELLKSTEKVSFGFWRSDETGKPINGGRSKEAARLGLVQETEGPLEICTRRALHATVNPEKWKGERLWLVALFGETQQREDKLGALKREIIAEVDLPKT